MFKGYETIRRKFNVISQALGVSIGVHLRAEIRQPAIASYVDDDYSQGSRERAHILTVVYRARASGQRANLLWRNHESRDRAAPVYGADGRVRKRVDTKTGEITPLPDEQNCDAKAQMV